jgi:AraC family transcriptional regulator, activator of mtrCDE
MSDRADDPLLDTVLSAARVRAQITDHVQFCGRWHENDPQAPAGTAWFHLLDRGSCEVEVQGGERLQLNAGDFVMLTRGAAHRLFAAEGDAEGYASLLCGEFRFEPPSGARLLDGLPEAIHVPAEAGGGRFRQLSSLLLEEAGQQRFGRQAVMDRLADALFVMALRHQLDAQPVTRGLFAALADPRLRGALLALHAEPGAAWTVASLAARAHLSRTAFAERFQEVMGEAPIQYLTRWRMAQALVLLRDPRASVAQVGSRLGYATEAAFRRSFARAHGFGPGAYRKGAVSSG